jgi:hypothetical protein
MATKSLIDREAQVPQRPDIRSRQVGIRLSESEFAALEKLAWSEGRTPGEWAREFLSKVVRFGTEERIAEYAFAELVGLQLLLLNILQPLAAGQKISPEQFQRLVEQIQATKQAKARELLARRASREEKPSDQHL